MKNCIYNTLRKESVDVPLQIDSFTSIQDGHHS